MHSLFYFVKSCFCVLKHAFCIGLIFPFNGTPWSGICWLSVTFQGITWEGNTPKLTFLGLCMILYNFLFHLICLDFFFSLLSVVFKGRLLLALFCWMSELWGCFFYATVCWCIKPEGLQNHICLGMIVLFQLGGLLIRSGEGNHSSLWSNPLLRSAWLCCSSSGQFENSVPCGSCLDGSIQLS